MKVRFPGESGPFAHHDVPIAVVVVVEHLHAVKIVVSLPRLDPVQHERSPAVDVLQPAQTRRPLLEIALRLDDVQISVAIKIDHLRLDGNRSGENRA